MEDMSFSVKPLEQEADKMPPPPGAVGVASCENAQCAIYGGDIKRQQSNSYYLWGLSSRDEMGRWREGEQTARDDWWHC